MPSARPSVVSLRCTEIVDVNDLNLGVHPQFDRDIAHGLHRQVGVRTSFENKHLYAHRFKLARALAFMFQS